MSGVSAIVFAYHGFGVEGLEALARLGVQVRRVFTHADHPGEQIWWRSVAEWASRQGIPCELDADLQAPDVRARIFAEAPDFIFSFYYRRMISEAVLAHAKRGAFNLHGSLLPKFRGRSPINWQLVMGAPRSGLTLHRMVRQADAGELIAQQAVAVHPDQDALGLTRQLLAIAPTFLEGAIADIIAERIRPQAQDHAQATYFGGRTPAQGLIEWRRSAREIHNLVRAVAPPWPGAFTSLLGRQLLVWRTAVVHERSRYGDAGTVLGDGTIACGTGSLMLLSMAWADDHAPVALVAGLRLISPPST
jgi:UDP-4-amino-4-deoxy-L-arabinose formyltransferase/UDP-glucuronic acid dehydrogenase (UDP-4-keto-hexauronic acid decarboxylating)